MTKLLCTFTCIAALTLTILGCGSNDDGAKIGAAGQACTSGGGCDPGLKCRTADHICEAPSDAMPAISSPDAGSASKCSTGPLGGIGVPAGTVATASASYTATSPQEAFDGSLLTVWNSGGYTGWLKLQFPQPTAITAVRIQAGAKPTTNVTYTIGADSRTNIGSGTRQVAAGSTTGSLLDPIAVTPGSYSSLTITVNGGATWVQINELSLMNDECPPATPPGTGTTTGTCGCETRLCGDDGCGHACGSCEYGEICIAGDCVSHTE